jgi:aryl-alcohol dehydrogenase-like predicted oxidoreductase
LKIAPVGFGAWAIGGSGWEFAWGPQDDADSITAIHRALELGVNWVDTAAVYGLGHSEAVVARALEDWRGSPPYSSQSVLCAETSREKSERDSAPSPSAANVKTACAVCK